MNNNVILLILGMMLVTYIPRLLPFYFLSNRIPKGLNRFLSLIPYTALGALIVPGVFSATPQMPAAAIVGIGLAGLLVWKKGGIIMPVIGSVLVTFVVLVSRSHI